MSLINGQLKSRVGYIPNEVLSLIFLQCLEVDILGCTFPNPLQAPLVLSWVCRLWRNVAVNTHYLWTAVAFARKADRIDDSTRLLELWISRSGALPFGVKLPNLIGEDESLFSINNRVEWDPVLVKGVQAFIDVLLTCSKRWRVIELIVPEVSLATPVLQALVTDARGLEHFAVTTQYLGLYETPVKCDFSSNTALRTVRIITPIIHTLPTGNRDTFASLTLLELHFCTSLQECLTWLDMTPNIEYLILRLYGTGQIPLQGRHVRRLPRLGTLEITCFSADSRFHDPGLLLDVLELPELTELELELNYLFDTAPWPHLRDLLVRSGTSLEGLILSGTPMSEVEIIECLRLSPNLECLSCAVVTDNILLELTPRLLPEVMSSSAVQPLEEGESQPQTSNNDMEIDDTPPSEARAVDGQPESEDPNKYAVLCPQLQYFEGEDIDVCSLQALYAMMSARCEDIYKDIRDYVDVSAIRPTPEAFKTLISVVLPCDPMYSVLSHPQILECMERTVYF